MFRPYNQVIIRSTSKLSLQMLCLIFRGGPDEDLIIRSKHVVIYIMKNEN